MHHLPEVINNLNYLINNNYIYLINNKFLFQKYFKDTSIQIKNRNKIC